MTHVPSMEVSGLAGHSAAALLEKLDPAITGWLAVAALRLLPLDDAHREELATLGVALEGAQGAGNRVLMPAEGFGGRLSVRVGRRLDGLLILGRHPGLSGKVEMSGRGQLCLVGESRYKSVYLLTLRGTANFIAIGPDCSSNGVNCMVVGQGLRLTIGPDCMMSSGITMRTADSHAVVDLATGLLVNPPADVSLASHVWLAQDAMMLKGARIGEGAIVAARALVNRDVPACTLVVGAPARVQREGVSWTREMKPSSATIAQLQAAFGRAPSGPEAS